MKQFMGFVFVSAIAATVNIGSRALLDNLFAYSTSIVIAFVFGLTTAFVLNRMFVFQGGSEKLEKQAGWFLVVNLFALAQTIVISLALARWLLPAIGWTWHTETVAHAVGVGFPILSSYLGHKHFSFRKAS